MRDTSWVAAPMEWGEPAASGPVCGANRGFAVFNPSRVSPACFLFFPGVAIFPLIQPIFLPPGAKLRGLGSITDVPVGERGNAVFRLLLSAHRVLRQVSPELCKSCLREHSLMEEPDPIWKTRGQMEEIRSVPLRSLRSDEGYIVLPWERPAGMVGSSQSDGGDRTHKHLH